MRLREAGIREKDQRIERAEADRCFGVLDRSRAVARPCTDARAEAECLRRRRAQRHRPVKGIESGLIVLFENSDDKGGHRESGGIVAAGRDREAGMA